MPSNLAATVLLPLAWSNACSTASVSYRRQLGQVFPGTQRAVGKLGSLSIHAKAAHRRQVV